MLAQYQNRIFAAASQRERDVRCETTAASLNLKRRLKRDGWAVEVCRDHDWLGARCIRLPTRVYPARSHRIYTTKATVLEGICTHTGLSSRCVVSIGGHSKLRYGVKWYSSCWNAFLGQGAMSSMLRRGFAGRAVSPVEERALASRISDFAVIGRRYECTKQWRECVLRDRVSITKQGAIFVECLMLI